MSSTRKRFEFASLQLEYWSNEEQRYMQCQHPVNSPSSRKIEIVSDEKPRTSRYSQQSTSEHVIRKNRRSSVIQNANISANSVTPVLRKQTVFPVNDKRIINTSYGRQKRLEHRHERYVRSRCVSEVNSRGEEINRGIPSFSQSVYEDRTLAERKSIGHETNPDRSSSSTASINRRDVRTVELDDSSRCRSQPSFHSTSSTVTKRELSSAERTLLEQYRVTEEQRRTTVIRKEHKFPKELADDDVTSMQERYSLNSASYHIVLLTDERDNIQKKTFTKWVNKHLSKAGVKVEDLFEDLRDGYKLIALLEALTGEKLNRENGYTRFHRIQNVQYCLDFLKSKNIKLVNIRPEDIVEGNPKLTLGLIWTIILNFQVSVIKQRQIEQWVPSPTSISHNGQSTTTNQVSEILHGSDVSNARDALLQWARKVTAGYPRVDVKNFSSSWRDGLAFNAILHRYRPNLIDWNKISDPSVSNRERLENAFAEAEREFGVSRLLDPEDVDTDNPDEKSIITYVSSLYEALPHQPELSMGNLNDIISRLTRGIGITNEKLDLILNRIEDVENRVDKASPIEIERLVNGIVEDLNALEAPIAGFFEDVDELKNHQHPEANDFYRQVYGLHQRRTVYLDRLTNKLLVRLGLRTETLRKESQARLESIRQSTFSRVEECIEWVRLRLEKLTEMEFLENLETLEEMFEQHKVDNRDIQDFRQNVDECIARQAEVSAEDTHEYCELLRVLESEYQQLRDLSAGRMLDLDSLIAFVRAAQLELVWVSEREDIEVSRNWSDIKQLDLPMLQNYYKQLLHEMELRERRYNDVHNQGAALLNQGHPAIHVIEVYLKTMEHKWDWLLSLSKCLEEHLRDALNLKSFLEEAADAETWMEEQAQRLENNYNRTDFSLEEGERYLRELDEIKDILNKYHSVIMALTERCATISPLWQRGERITRPITVTALCDFSEKNIVIKAGDEVTLLDNSDLIKWQIRDLSGTEGVVPSVVFRIPPPDLKLTNYLNRLLQQFEKLRKLWDKKHRMVRFNMVLNTMKTIQGWDLDTFNSIDPDQREAIIRALNDDANKLLSELDPNDPLALRLREELRKTNEHFCNLLNASQKPPEPDYSNQFDEKMNDLLRKLEEAWRNLNDNVGKPVSRTPEDLEKVIHAHKQFEDDLQALDTDVANVKELFRQLPNPTPSQRINHDRLNTIWEDLWDLSRMYVERIKVLESVLNGMIEVSDIVKAHEVTLNSFDDMPAALDKLRGHHAQLLEMNMVLQQQQSVIDSLNKNVALLRQHVARTRLNQGSHPDVDRIEEEVQQLNVRWENVGAQVADRLKATERALQIQMVYRSEYECEMAWLDRVEETINRLRKPDELRPEEYQHQLDILAAEYAQLQERTEAIENVNREGGKFIREAKGYDSRMGQFGDAVVGIHGPSVRQLFRRTQPQPKNGAQIVTEELEALNRRFAQLSSLILEKRNHMQVLIQNWKRQKQDEVAEVASAQVATITEMNEDLNNFRDKIFQHHLKFDLSADSAVGASQSVQSIKESLDNWRDDIKRKLDAVDQLCRDNADNMTPEQFAQLRDSRNQLSQDYENVVRTVEGVYGRLNEITALLVSFSTMSSEMQSWMTDRTRLAGEIKVNSADPRIMDQSKQEAKNLLNEVENRQEKLNSIASVLNKLETEIEMMYQSAPGCAEKTIHSGDVKQNMYRVQDDYSQLVKQCQDLIQFQNRLISLDDELHESNRKLDDRLALIEGKLTNVNDANHTPENKLLLLDTVGSESEGLEDLMREADQSVLRFLLALEGSGVSQDVKDQRTLELDARKKKLEELLKDIQTSKNEAAVQLSANEEVRDAVDNLAKWVSNFEKTVSQPFSLPMKQDSLNNLSHEEQKLRSDMESKKATLNGLENEIMKSEKLIGEEAANRLMKSLEDSKRRLQRSSSNLQGLRDNINDAHEGVQSLHVANEAISDSCQQAISVIENTNPKDRTRLNSCCDNVESLKKQLNGMNNTMKVLLSLPHATETEEIEQIVKIANTNVDQVQDALELKESKHVQNAELEDKLMKAKEKTADWIGSIDARLIGLKPVSILSEKLSKQKDECTLLANEHSEGLRKLQELEDIVLKMSEFEEGGRNSIYPRHVFDLVVRYNSQAEALKNRMNKINTNERKANELDEKQQEIHGFITLHENQLKKYALPSDKNELNEAVNLLNEVEQTVRKEQKNLEETRLSARELVRSSSMDEECEIVKKTDEKLSDAWNSLSDSIHGFRQRTSQAEQLLDGGLEEAHTALLGWLEETEEILKNQKQPSSDEKVARAQLQAYDVLLKFIEEKETNVNGFSALAGKFIELTPSPIEKTNLKKKEESIRERYRDLLQGAQDKQASLMEAVDLAERLTECAVPLDNWLMKTEKSVQSLAVFPTDPDRAAQMLDCHLQIAEEVKSKAADVSTVLSILPVLKSLVNAEDAAQLEKDSNQLKTRFESLDSRVESMREMLSDLATQVGDFDHDSNELLKWLSETENKLSEMDELAIEPDDLMEQCNLLSDLAESITDHDEMVMAVIQVGQVLCKQASPEDTVNIQNRLSNLKIRYQGLMSSADDKLAAISKAVPLSERFHEGFDAVMQWVEAVEEDLQNVDDADVETQAHLIFTIEEDVTRWRPEVDDLVAVSTQLQSLCSAERAEELYQNTSEMNKRVHEISNKVARRAERLDLTERQSREVLDELEFLIEWLQDARERVVTAQRPSIDPEFVKIQLRNQKIMNEDVTANKAKLREIVSEAKKVIRQLGPGGVENPSFSVLNDKCETGKQIVDDVASFCMDRTDCLEQAVALLAQLTSEFDELSNAVDQIDDELRGAPEIMTTTPSVELRRMHNHNSELIGALTAYKPLVDRFSLDVAAMQELCSEHEGMKLGELAEEFNLKYQEVFDAAKKRGDVLDSIFDATSGFGERLEKFVENLQGAADKLRDNSYVSADPVVIEAKLSENVAVLESLRDKEGTYSALKESAAELLSSAPQGDIAAQDVVDKLDRLEKLWRDIEEEAVSRGSFLNDVLNKAKTFWSELDQCQKAVDDLRVRLEAVEPAIGQPEQIQQQQAVMNEVAGVMSTTGPRILSLCGAGTALSDVIAPEEQVIVKTQVDAVQENWGTITKLFTDKNRDLIIAMEEAMTFHDNLAGLLGWMNKAEAYVLTLKPADSLRIDEIPAELEALHRFKDNVDEQALVKEHLAHTATQLASGAPPLHAAAVRQPISDLNARWAKLYGALADREHKIEKALLQMGRLSEAANQLIAWIDHTRTSLSELKEDEAANLRQVEIKLCKLAVIKNDVHSHEQSVNTLNSAAQHLIKEESNLDIAAKMDSLNQKWRDLQVDLQSLADQIEKARGEAENVGGELERWLSWLDDVEHQLTTTKPTGGLPETAEAQLDDFRVLRAEVEQNCPALDDYLKETEKYLSDHGNDRESWIGKSYGQMKNKWNRVKELCVDREKKLQVALNEAIALHEAMLECDQWLKEAEKKLTSLQPVSRILEVVEAQLEEHELFSEEVNERKQILADLRATGTRLQYYCETKDAIPIKNGLVTRKHRFEKVLNRTTDRGKQLTLAAEEVRTWISGVETLENWMDDVEGRLAEESPSTSSVDRLKLQLENIIEIQGELAERHPQYEISKKRGTNLADHAPKADAKLINSRNNALSKRWKALTALCLDKQREAEQAVIEGGAFDEAMLKLEQWIDDEMQRLKSEDSDKVYGDLPTVRSLIEAESNKAAERQAKHQGVESVLKKTKDLLAKGVDEAPAVQESAQRLNEKWLELDQAAKKRADSLKNAEELAAEFDETAHSLLDWLAQTETKLKKPVTDVQSSLAELNGIKDDMDSNTPNKNKILAQGQAIRDKCHPKAEQNVKHWIRVLDARWKEVEEKLSDREFNLLEEEQNEKDLEEKLKELREFVTNKRSDLNEMTSHPLPSDLETLDAMQKNHEHLDFDLRERQPDIENATKSVRKNIRNPVADQLSSDWKQLWIESMGHQAALDKQRDLLNELKRLEGWKWEDWKERYVEFNDHGKARVTDLFRRIDRSHTGRVPRNVFIDGIIASRFPTSRLEMEKVADLFDKDGLIDSKQFINALRFDLANRVREPVTDNEKINEEISRQCKVCNCCKPYVIEKITDGHYRFGDTQIKRMVRILRSTVMVRVGGGWETLEEFLGKHDPCRAKGRLNINLLYKDVAPSHAIDTMRAFTKNRHSRGSGEFTGIPGPIMKIREKTERSLPMFPHKHERTLSDLSTGGESITGRESRIARPSSRNSITKNKI